LEWNLGDGTIERFSRQTGKMISHIYPDTGQYQIKVKKYISGIYREIDSYVSIVERPIVNLGADTVLCRGDALNLDPGCDGVTYEWSTGATSRNITIDKAAQYSVRVGNGACKAADTVTVQVLEYPGIELGPDRVICDEDSSKVFVEPNSNYEYAWSTGDRTNQINASSSGEYSVTVRHGRCATTDKIHVRFESIKNFRLSKTLIEATYGDDTFLEAEGDNIDSWDWTFGDGLKETTTARAVSHRYERAGRFTGELQVSNSFGCTDKERFEIDVPYHLLIPNVFTPNNDGFNDTFVIEFNGIGDLRINIYDRLGKKVFSSSTVENAWDGADVANGTYYYQIAIGDTLYKGWVSLLR
jgi:gliding motility-associated-like protein